MIMEDNGEKGMADEILCSSIKEGRITFNAPLYWLYLHPLGLLMLLPIVVALIYGEVKLVSSFLYSSLISILIGAIFYRFFKSRGELSLRGAMIFSSSLWLLVCALGALPYYLSGYLSYFDAYFEAMSGFTTTGFSMFPNLDIVPYSIHFWRGFTQWLGGIGIIVLALVILSPSRNIMRLYISEGREERVLPTIRSTVRIILYIYLIYTLISIILYLVAGMPLFDSMFHAFSALSTGGFAMHNSSIAYYHSIWIEIVAMIVMIMGATNFAVHYAILKGKWKEYFKDIETKVSWPLLILGTLIITMFLYNMHYYDILSSLRYSIFQVVSALSTTGFQTVSGPGISKWAGLGMFILTILMIIGAGSCSTGGGIKWIRFGIMLNGISWGIKSFLFPKAKIPRKIHHIFDMNISKEIFEMTGLFIFAYILIYVISVMIVLFYYHNIGQVMFEVASAQSNVGLSCGLMTPASPAITKLVFMLDFWVGRLEIWPILLFITIPLLNIKRRI